jgi:hypothetical protein
LALTWAKNSNPLAKAGHAYKITATTLEKVHIVFNTVLVSNFIRYGQLWQTKFGLTIATIPAQQKIMTKFKLTIVPLPELHNPDGRSHTSNKGHPNSTLEPDWDVLHEIKRKFYQQLHGGTLLHTSKGHQDNRQKYDRLPLLAQLNVNADRLAGLYQGLYGATHPIVILFPPHSAA